jgi:DNA-binding transcriptional ArsR family regulator
MAQPRPQDRLAEQHIGQIFQALADPTRRAVIEKLAVGPASMTELARPFSMALPSFAQHLAVLEKTGVVLSTKTGRVRTYGLAPQSLALAEDWFVAQRKIWEQRLDRLQEHLEQMNEEDR